MQRNLTSAVNSYTKGSQRRKLWQRIVSTLTCIVVFCTTYALILPAITLTDGTYCSAVEHTHTDLCYSESETVITYTCLSELHVHTDDCYDETGTLICGVADFVLHTHSDSCYDTNGALICQLEENEAHTHTDQCEQSSECTLAELEAHTHSEECYTDGVLTCGMLQLQEHQHTADCVHVEVKEAELVCGQEEHTHTLACYSDPSADLENAAVWEQTLSEVELTGDWAMDILNIAKTQLGYEESEENYIVLDDGETTKGYTRYGQWAKDPYADWNQLFVEFCLAYAQISEDIFPRAEEGERWFEVLDDSGWAEYAGYVPCEGELIFADIDGVECVGIVSSVSDDGDITAIFGDYEGAVGERTVSYTDSSIKGFALMPSGYLSGVLEDTESNENETTDGGSYGNAIDMKDYITDVSVTVNGIEVEESEVAISYSDTIRFYVEYCLTADALKDTNTVTYQLPESFSLYGATENGAVSGAVKDSQNNTVGTYTYENGVLTIVYSDYYVTENKDNDQPISGTIVLEAAGWSFSSTEDTTIDFANGGDITLYFPQSDNVTTESTVNVSKSAAIVSTDGSNAVVKYTVVVYSAPGTNGTISLDDVLSDGQNYVISSEYPLIIDGTKYSSGTVDQTLTQLSAGQSHVVTYYATVPIGSDGTVQGNNKATVTTKDAEGNEVTDSSTAYVYDTVVAKDGWADTTNNRIWWTVYVGVPGQSLEDWSLSDSLDTAAKDITVTYYTDESCTQSMSVSLSTLAGGYTFPEGAYGEARITYYTDYANTQLGYNYVTNTATLKDPSDNSYTSEKQVWTENYNPASKTFAGFGTTAPDTDGNVIVNWTYTINTTEGPIIVNQTDDTGSFWCFKDSLYNGFYTEAQYNALRDQLAEALDNALSHTHSDTCYDTNSLVCTEHVHSDECYTDGTLTCGYPDHTHSVTCYELICGRTEATYHTHISSCYDNGELTCNETENTDTVLEFTQLTSSDSSGTYITGIHVKVYQDLPQGNVITLNYSSTVNVGDGTKSVYFGNDAYINEANGVNSYQNYTPIIQKMDALNNSTSDTNHAQMDITDESGNVNVSWKIQVYLPEEVSTAVTITETLPAEVDLSSVTLTLPGSSNAITLSGSVTYGDVKDAAVTVSAVDSTNNQFTITIPKDLANALQGKTFTIQVNTTVKDAHKLVVESSDKTDDGDTTESTLTSLSLENSATVSYKDTNDTVKSFTDSQTQTLTSKNTTERIKKTSTADNNSNEITYLIEVNPEAADLNPNGDYLTIEDLMTYWSSISSPVGSSLKADSVHVYIEKTVTGPAGTAIEIPDLVCGEWFENVVDTVTTTDEDGNDVTEQMLVTPTGISITLTNTTDADAGAGDYRFVPTVVLYTGTNGYDSSTAIWYHSGVNKGWSSTIQDANGKTPDTDNFTAAQLYSVYGITFTSILDSNVFPGWDNLVEMLQSGVECTITAHTESEPTETNENAGYVVLKIDMAGIYDSIKIPVDNINGIYLALSGENTTLSDIKYSNSIESYKKWELVSDFTFVHSQYETTLDWNTSGYYVNNSMNFVVPDEEHLVIQYTYTFTGDLGTWASVSNTASLSGSSEISDTDGVEIKLSNAVTANVNLTVYKVDADDYKLGLSDAVFDLYKWVPDGGADEDGNPTGEWVWDQTTTSSSNGNLVIKDLDENQAYYLIEVIAPSGYILDQTRHYFLIKNSYNDTVIAPSDFPLSAYRPKGSILSIPNTKADTDVTVEKVWQDENGEQTNPPVGGEVQLQLMQVLHAFSDDFDYDNIGKEEVTISVNLGQYSYQTYYTHEITAKVGSYVLINVTVPNQYDSEGNLMEAGLMDVTRGVNYYLRYSKTDNKDGTTTYTFRYLVTDTGDEDNVITLRGWTYIPDAGEDGKYTEAEGITITDGNYAYVPLTLSVGSADKDTLYLDPMKLDAFETGKLTFRITVPKVEDASKPAIYINDDDPIYSVSDISNDDGTVTFMYEYKVPVDSTGVSIHFAIGSYDPNSVTVEVDGYIEKYGEAITLNRFSGWTKDYNVPAYLQDEKTGKIIGYYSYYVVETSVNENYVTDYYTVSDDYLLVYNRYLPTHDLEVQKEWAEGTTLTEVEVQLYQIAGNMPIYTGMGEDATVKVGIQFKNGYLDLSTGTVSSSLYTLNCKTGTTVKIQLTSKWNVNEYGSWYADPTFSLSDGSNCTVTSVINASGSTTYVISFVVNGDVSLTSKIDYNLVTESLTDGDFTVDNISVNIPTIYSNTPYNGSIALNTGNGWKYTWEDLPSVGVDQNGDTIYYTYYVKELSTGNSSDAYTVYYSADGINYDTDSPPVVSGTLYVLNTDQESDVKVTKDWIGPDGLDAIASSESVQFELYKWTVAQDTGSGATKYTVSATYSDSVSASGSYEEGTTLYIDVIADDNAQYDLVVKDWDTGYEATKVGSRTAVALLDGTTAYKYTFEYVVNPTNVNFGVYTQVVYDIVFSSSSSDEELPAINDENWIKVGDSYTLSSTDDWTKILSGLDSGAYYKIVETGTSDVIYYVNGTEVGSSGAVFKAEDGVVSVGLTNKVDNTELTVNKRWTSGTEQKDITMQLYRIASSKGLDILLADDYLDCTEWREDNFAPLQITEEGLAVTFKAQTSSTDYLTKYCPYWVLYASNDGTVNADNDTSYVEYWVQRADNYGWATAGEDGENSGYFAEALNRDSGNAVLNKYGIYQSYQELVDDNGEWTYDFEAAFIEAMMNGVEVTVTAKLVGDDAVITMSVPVTMTDGSTAICSSTMTIPVDDTKPVYLGLTGDKVTLTNIFAVTGSDSVYTIDSLISYTNDAGETINGSVKLTETGNWTYTWEELPLSGTITNTDGTTETVFYTYYALEDTSAMGDYNTSYELSSDGSVLTVTNDSSTTVEVEKVWLDKNGNPDTDEHKDVQVQLMQVSSPVAPTELDFTGWWKAFTDGVQLTTDGVYITFTNTTYNTDEAKGTNNGPLVHLYICDDPETCTFATGVNGYAEIWTHRGDNYGWTNNATYFDSALTSNWFDTNNAALMETYGITWESISEPGCWDNFLDNMKAGCDGTVIAWLEQDSAGQWYAVFTIEFNGVTNTVKLPVVDEDEDTTTPPKIYLSLTGELTTFTNILVTEGKSRTDNGKLIGTYTLNSSNDWQQIISGLPTFGIVDGEKVYYTYYFKEIEVEGYTTTYSSAIPIEGGSVTITNTEMNSITVDKVWVDENGNEIEPADDAQVEVQLMQIANAGFADTLSSYSESEEFLDELVNSSWAENYTNGITLDSAGIKFTFKAQSFADVVNQWNSPIMVVYTCDDPENTTFDSDDASYTKYWEQRLDNNGAGDYCVSMNAVFASGFSWEDFAAALASGVDCTATAVRDGEYVTLMIEGGGITMNAVVKVDANKPVYLSLTGGVCNLTDIEISYGQLRTNGTQYGDSVILNSDKDWQYTWGSLPEYAYDETTGQWIYYTYYVVESHITGYSATYSIIHPITDGEVTVTNKPVDSTQVTVDKEWAGGTTVGQVVMQLYQIFTPRESGDTESHTHSFTRTVIAATCESQGYTTYTCSCGDSYKVNFVAATGHSWDEGKVSVEPTQTEAGVLTYTCANCGATKTETIAATGHTHTWSEWTVTKAATCTEAGSKTRTCTSCTDSETVEIEATGHSYTSVVTAPSCTEAGYTTYTCSNCSDSYTGNEVAATGHTWGEGVVTTPATDTTNGVLTYTCTVSGCGATKTETIAATGHTHTWTDWSITTEATCTQTGIKTRTCTSTSCGATETEEIAATGHSYNSVVTAPTCTEQGHTTHTCSTCGDTYMDTYTDATGHSYSSVVTAPTCTEQGYTTYTCSNCSDSYTGNQVASNGHTAGSTVIENNVAATETTAGSYDEVVYCTACGTQISRTTVTVPATSTTGYTATLYYTAGDYWPSTSGDVTVEVNGADEYTLTWYPGITATGLYSFYVKIPDFYDVYTANYTVADVKVYVDGVAVDVDLNYAYLGASWDNSTQDFSNDFVIELYNYWSDTRAVSDAAMTFSQSLTITFTLAESSVFSYSLNYEAPTVNSAAVIDESGEEETTTLSGDLIGEVTLTTAENPDMIYTWENLPLYAYDADGNIVGEYSYYVVESVDGFYDVTYTYDVNGVIVTVADEMTSAVTGGTITVTNSGGYGYELPESGGDGTFLYTLGGLALMCLAVLMYNHKKGRKGVLAP